jgi:diguanylate cyclase (GGDEF)-like protein
MKPASPAERRTEPVITPASIGGRWLRALPQSGSFQVWTFMAAMVVASILIISRLNLSASSYIQPSLPWPTMAILITVIQFASINRSPNVNQTVTWYPLATFIGALVIFMAPEQVLIGMVVGDMMVAAIHWKTKPPVKHAFNLVHDLLAISLVLVLLQWLRPHIGPASPDVAALYFLLQMTLDAVTIITVRVVIGLYSRTWDRRSWDLRGGMLILEEASLWALGAILMFLLTVSRVTGVLVLLPIIWVAILQNRSVSQDAERTRLLELHELGELLLLGSDVSQSMTNYVHRASRLLSSDFVQVIILGRGVTALGAGDSPRLHAAGGFRVTLERASEVTTAEVGGFAATERAFLLHMQSLGEARMGDDGMTPDIASYFAGLGLLEGFAIRLGDPDGMLGVIVAGNGTAVSRRDAGRLLLGRNLAMQTTIALERSDLLAQIHTSVAEKERLLKRALSDSLTGIGNREYFRDRLAAALEDGQSSLVGVGVLYIDLDGFKAINDDCGHSCGDEVLQVVARRLEQAVRPEDVVARLGGDEFAVVLAGIENEDAALAVADRVVTSLAAPVRTKAGQRVPLGASVGAAYSGDAATSVDAIIKAADRAMYRAKREGRNQVRLALLAPHLTAVAG